LQEQLFLLSQLL